MWQWLVRQILRNRMVNLTIIFILTALMGYQALKVEISYEYAQMLPQSDPAFQDLNQFRSMFEEDGSIFFVGIQDERFNDIDVFKDWYNLTILLKNKVDGIKEVFSHANVFNLHRNDSLKQFEILPVMKDCPETQQELDSLLAEIHSLCFYDEFLFNSSTGVNMMLIWIEKDKLNTKNRNVLLEQLKQPFESFSEKHKIDVHYSGLPYIRTVTSQKIEEEILKFVFLALVVAAIFLFIFFRSFKAVFFPLVIVGIGVVWSLGTLVLFGYQITVVTGILPPLLIVIGVENCIFLLNKYHQEYQHHGNKIKALSRVVMRVGQATFLTNATTAAGFAAFIVTGNNMLVEFGIVASINIVLMFFFSLFLIPTFYSFLEPPKRRHLKHLENRILGFLLRKISLVVQNRRKLVYLFAVLILGLGIFGMTKLQTTGNMVDDIPHNDPMYEDLLFFQENMSGVLPLEFSIDTKKDKGVMRMQTLQKIDALQDVISSYPELSKSLSVVEVVKFAKQAFYSGDSSRYSLPNNHERNFILSYVPGLDANSNVEILNSFVDTNYRIARVSTRMNNIGTHDINRITEDMQPKIDSIFNPEEYDVVITGTSVVFLKGTSYLVNNLRTSLLIAILAITILMMFLFKSFKMVIISLAPNLLPQIMTAGMMGFLGIPIKPSTILIFSIALGISVNDAIHYLSRFRMELKWNNENIKVSVLNALKETGYSMIYSSIVLFFGFSIFVFSSFGGTASLGYLISFTLLIAVFLNLIMLPSLLLSMEKRISKKVFRKQALIEDEADDEE
jgi:predicted RND superfamily exporter protein